MESGDIFGRYLIREKIGEGGMGEVYLADDTRLSRKVALKVLARAVADDGERLRRFEQEARAASALNHPNILTVHEFGEENGAAFLASEYVEGRTLRELITLKELDLRTGLKIAEQTAFALDTAHQAGIIHRDIKPENIMIRKDGIVKILDFGLAKLVERVEAQSEDETRAHFKTAAGHIVGTATYMSPEQARGKADIDARTDLWSLGVLIHEMFAGKPPFTGESISDVIASVLKTEPEPLVRLVEDCPPELDRIVTKALRKDREERYQVIKDLALDIRSLRKQLEFSAQYSRSIGGVSGMMTSEHARTQTTSFAAPVRSPLWIAGAALILISAIAGGAWFAYSKLAAPIETAPLKSVEIVSWTSSPGEVYSTGSFSPDGRMIAFASTQSGSKNIWIKQTSAGEARQITNDDFRNENPIWSPSGEELAFFSSRGRRAGFWRIPVLGGTPKLVANLPDGGARLLLWAADDRIYFESENELLALSVGSSEIVKISNFAATGIEPKSLALSRDLLNITYVTVQGESSILWVSGANGDAPRQVVSTPNRIRDLVWHPDDKRMFYSALVDGNFQIFLTDTSGTPPRQLSFAGEDALVKDVSADGSKVLFGSAKEESNLWGANVKDGKEFIVASDKDSKLWPAVSPDGKTLAYQSVKDLSQGNRITSGNILTIAKDGASQPREVVSKAYLPSWSPDGSRLAFLRVAGSKKQIEVTDIVTGEQKKLISDGVSISGYSMLPYNRFQAADFSWSPDGSKIAYLSSKSGQSNLWFADSNGTYDTQITENTEPNRNLYCPLWSPDGLKLALSTKTDDGESLPQYGIVLVETNSKTILPIYSQNSFIRLAGWSASGGELILASVEASESEGKGSAIDGLPKDVRMLSLEIAKKQTRELGSLNSAYPINIHMSDDKKAIAFVAHREGKDNIWIRPITGGEARRITNNNDSRLYFSSLSWSPDGNNVYFGKQLRYSILSMLTNFQ